ETHVIRGINWRETFPFTNIFRSFRVAIHPSKLILALIAILLIYISGRLLDGMTPASKRGIPNEIEYYESFHAGRMMIGDTGAIVPEANAEARKLVGEKSADFMAFHDNFRKHMEDDYAQGLLHLKIKGSDDKPLTADEAKVAARSGKYLDNVKEKIV